MHNQDDTRVPPVGHMCTGETFTFITAGPEYKSFTVKDLYSGPVIMSPTLGSWWGTDILVLVPGISVLRNFLLGYFC